MEQKWYGLSSMTELIGIGENKVYLEKNGKGISLDFGKN
jgi:hypothetical protein